MAYKDEYEVARLYTGTAFMAKVNAQFEGDFKLKFHLAPPLLARRNAKGELVKKQYGAWMMGAFRLLAGLKGLRGGPLDILGYTAERKMERALIVQYRETMHSLLGELSTANLDQALALASLPEEIRGYGHVKERHVRAAQTKRAQLLSAMRAPVEAAAKAA
jgi:indolepyruvate ferredoxin oxidoreductase